MPKPTSRDFAYSTGAAPLGSTKVGNIIIGKPTNGFVGTGMPWYGGPDEDKGYILALSRLSPNWVTAVNRPSIDSNIGFARSLLKSEASFLNLVNQKYNQSFNVGEKASTYLRTLGFWDSYSGNGGATNGLIFDLNVLYSDSYPGAGTVWNDLSGNFNPANLINGPLYKTVGGRQFVFDAFDDRAETNVGQLGNNATYEAVVYSTGNVNGYQMFIGQYLPYIGFYQGNSIVYSDYINGNQTWFVGSEGLLSSTKWYHVVCTREYDPTDGVTNMFIWINGSQVSGISVVGQKTVAAASPITVGDGANFTWYPFRGSIFAARAYNRALNEKEINQNYLFYLPRMYTEQGLQFYIDGGSADSYVGTGISTLRDLYEYRDVNYGNVQLSKNGRYSLFSGTTAEASSSPLLNTDTHTVELLIMFKSTSTYPNGTSGNWDKFFSYNGGGTDRSPGVWRFPSQRLIHWQYAPNFNGPNFGKNSSNEEFDLDTYYHVIVTKSADNVKTYVNGILTNNIFGVSNPKTAGDAAVIFFEYFTSGLMEIQLCRIYNRAITEDEAITNYTTIENRILL